MVGSVVFVIGSTILYLEIHELGMNPFWAQFPMLLLSMTCSWLLNRWLTFRAKSGLTWWREWFRFMIVNGIGAIISSGTYTLILFLTHKSSFMPYFALGVGTLVALSWNYLGSKHVVWRGHRG